MTGLVLLVGVLWVFGGLQQSGVLAQDGGKFSYPRALGKLESLVASLNESLHLTKADLYELRLCVNLTKKILGEVQGENEVLRQNNGRLEVQLLETRRELATTKSLHQQAIDELRAAQDSSRVEALERQGTKLERGLKQVRRKVSEIENEHLPRQLNELTGDFVDLKRDLRRLEDENLPRKVNNVFVKLLTVEIVHNSSTTKLKEEQRRLQGEMQLLETKLEAALIMRDEQVANMVQELTEKHNSLELKLDEVAIGEEEWESRIASSRAVEEVSVSVRVLEGALSNMTAVIGKGLKETKANFGALKDEVEYVQNELCEKVQNLTIFVEDAKESTEESITVIKREINGSRSLAATQQESIDRLIIQVTQKGQSVNQLSDSVTDQGRRLDNLTSTVEEQGTCIASLKEDVEQIKSGRIMITDCYNAMMRGYNNSGVYTIRLNNSRIPFTNVYCDMETDGGGWTVLLKRQDGSVDFYRNWTDYKTGFGNLEGEHWLGLDNMYLFTHQSSAPPQLRVDLADWEGNTAFAKYDQFSVGAQDSYYTLSVSGYQSASTAGDALTYHNGQRFSTPDCDNDLYIGHCALIDHGPWWHRSCYHSLLTGKYYTSGGPWPEPHGISWYYWKSNHYSLRVAEMKIRPGGV